MKIEKTTLVLAVKLLGVLTAVMLFLQSLHPAWRSHMQVDSYFVFYDRAHHLFTHGNLATLEFNEYQPGAMVFFSLLSPLFLFTESREVFQNTLIILNLLLIILYARTARMTNGPWGAASLFLILLCTGPLLLFRFEVFVHLLIVVSIIVWNKKKHLWAMVPLAFATLTKLYPIVLAPYFALLALHHKDWKYAARVVVTYAGIMLLMLSAYAAAMKLGVVEILQQSLVHNKKPINLDTLFVSIISVTDLIQTATLPEWNGYLVHGIADTALWGPRALYDYVWVGVVGGVYLWLMRQTHLLKTFNPAVAALVLALFLLSNTQLNPQYFHWSLLFVPLITFRKKQSRQIVLLVFFACMTALLTQFVYPLWYSEFVSLYQTGVGSMLPFFLILVRNVIFVLYAVTLWKLLTTKD